MISYVLVPCGPHESLLKCGMECGVKVTNRHPSNKLTAIAVKKLTAPGRHADGNGLYLLIDPTGARADFFGQWNNIFMWSAIALALAAATTLVPHKPK